MERHQPAHRRSGHPRRGAIAADRIMRTDIGHDVADDKPRVAGCAVAEFADPAVAHVIDADDDRGRDVAGGRQRVHCGDRLPGTQILSVVKNQQVCGFRSGFRHGNGQSPTGQHYRIQHASRIHYDP